MLCEYRSNDRECLETMRVFFEKTFEAYRAMGVEVEAELVGERPCSGDVPQERMEALVARADSAISELFGVEAIHGPSSTDANIPLAAGREDDHHHHWSGNVPQEPRVRSGWRQHRRSAAWY